MSLSLQSEPRTHGVGGAVGGSVGRSVGVSVGGSAGVGGSVGGAGQGAPAIIWADVRQFGESKIVQSHPLGGW